MTEHAGPSGVPRWKGPPRLSTGKKILLSIAIVGAIAAGVGGTYASFSATTTNPTNTFASGTVTMTNVAGTAVSGSQCATQTTNGTCATLFSAASTALRPGGSDSTNTVTITYGGTIATGDFRLYAANYTSKTGSSSSFCTSTDPAAQVQLQVKQGTTIVYPTSGTGYGTLKGFATTYTSTSNGLQLNGGTGTAGVWATNDSAVFTLNLNLPSSTDNTFQGCQSQTDIVWYATQ